MGILASLILLGILASLINVFSSREQTKPSTRRERLDLDDRSKTTEEKLNQLFQNNK